MFGVAFGGDKKAKEEEAIEMALPWLRGKVDTGRYHSAGGTKKSKRAIKLPIIS